MNTVVHRTVHDCPTVKVQATNPEEQGPYVVINEVDYDPEVHTLYEEPDAVPAAKRRAPTQGAVAAKKTPRGKR